jgi:hypothetical protein
MTTEILRNSSVIVAVRLLGITPTRLHAQPLSRISSFRCQSF